MAEISGIKSADSAEKAYASAADAVIEKPAAPVAVTLVEDTATATSPFVSVPAKAAPVEFPAKAKRAAKPVVPAVAKKAEPAAKPVKVKKAAAAKPAKAKKAVTAAKKVAAPKAPVVSTPKAVVKSVAPKKSPISQIKEKIMATSKTTDFTDGFKTVVADAQVKAKEAFEKGSAAVAEAGEFTKGNAEAFVELGKILAAGLQDLGKTYVAEGRTAFETLTADVKQLSAVKSPTDFFKIQSELLRRNIDSAIAMTSKNSEAVLKLANDAFAPISGRVSLAVEKVKKAA